jgi:hypothetical protein
MTIPTRLLCDARDGSGRGSLLGDRSLPQAEPGWAPFDWPVGRWPDPLAFSAASASLLFFPANMYRFSRLKTAGYSWPI